MIYPPLQNLPIDNQNSSSNRRSAVIGGGLSGIAAAEYALRKGFQPEIFEWSGTLGGRLSSFSIPNVAEEIDCGQHIAMDCNKHLAELHENLQLEKYFTQCPAVSFINETGKFYRLCPSGFLPNKWKYLFSFLRFPFISFGERLKTLSLVKELGQIPEEQSKKCFTEFLAEHKVSENCIKSFWQPLVLSTLCETPENVCVKAVADVVNGMFLSNCPQIMQIPNVPLKEIYHNAVSVRFRQLNIPIHYFSRVKRLYWNEATETEQQNVFALETADGQIFDFDYFILAVPIWRARDILNQSDLEGYTEELGLERFESGAVTTVHLYLNRPLLPVSQPAAVLLNGIGQFIACHYRAEQEEAQGFKHTITISASHRLLPDEELTAKGSSAIIDKVLQQLSLSFPKAFSSKNQEPLKVLHSRAVTYFEAAFSPGSAVYSERPPQQTPFCNLALAGDWTQTGLPATMEGAVISGQKAVDVLIKNCRNSFQTE